MYSQVSTYRKALNDLRKARRSVCLELHDEKLKWKPDNMAIQALETQKKHLNKDIRHYELELAIFVENNLFQ